MNTIQQYQGVNAHNIALGSQESTMTMFVETANGGQSNSLLRPKKHMDQYPHIKFESTIQVPVKTLDSFSLDDRYNFLSIDVQGFELEVLKGAKETLKNIDFIICEVNNTELYLGCCMVEDIDDFLLQHGFRREATNWLGGTWGDGLYIRK
jgi:FkbM family methyltransferase